MVSIDHPLAQSLIDGYSTESPCPESCPGTLVQQADEDGQPTGPRICRHCQTCPESGQIVFEIEWDDGSDDRLKYTDEAHGDADRYVQDGAVPYFTRRASWFDDTDMADRDTILDQ